MFRHYNQDLSFFLRSDRHAVVPCEIDPMIDEKTFLNFLANIDDFEQDCSISSVLSIEILQSYTKPSTIYRSAYSAILQDFWTLCRYFVDILPVHHDVISRLCTLGHNILDEKGQFTSYRYYRGRHGHISKVDDGDFVFHPSFKNIEGVIHISHRVGSNCFHDKFPSIVYFSECMLYAYKDYAYISWPYQIHALVLNHNIVNRCEEKNTHTTILSIFHSGIT